MKTIFTVFKILFFGGRFELWPAQRVTESERIKISVKKRRSAFVRIA